MTQDVSITATPGALSHLLIGADDDFVDMRKKDHILPRAAIMQALSPDVVDGKFPAGTIVDSSTKAVLMEAKKDGLKIIPLMFWLEWIEWNRIRNVDKKERIVASSTDPQGELAKRADKWEVYINDQGKEVPTVTEYYNFVCVVIDPKAPTYDNAYLLGFARSSHKQGKMWLNRMYKTRINVDGAFVRPPMCFMQWAFKTELVKKDGNSYYVPCIGDGEEVPRELWPKLKTMSDEMKSMKQALMERNSNKDEGHADAGDAAAPMDTAKAEM